MAYTCQLHVLWWSQLREFKNHGRLNFDETHEKSPLPLLGIEWIQHLTG